MKTLIKKDVTCNKKFWTTVKPLFSYKTNQKITLVALVGDSQIISSDIKIADTMNNYFTNAML